MLIKSSIQRLRIISFLLFVTPAIALLGSIIIHNYLVSFKFFHDYNYNFEEDKPGNTVKILCSEENNFCDNILRVNKLNKCNKYTVDIKYVSATGDLVNKDSIKELNQEAFVIYENTEKLDKTCIINTNSIKYYNFAPFVFEKIYELKTNEKASTGTSETINPILYGETSISNVVKRFPVKLFFKPLMYISILFMVLYWIYYNLILNKLFNKQSKNAFFVLGILSALFLLLHVFFLGWTFESEILTKLRRTLIVFFILFEVLAQAFLIKDIFKRKSEISEYLNYVVVYSKLIFVSLIFFSTLIILTILIFYDLAPKIDYILEWNYFLILLIFYFLSSIMWKRNI